MTQYYAKTIQGITGYAYICQNCHHEDYFVYPGVTVQVCPMCKTANYVKPIQQQ